MISVPMTVSTQEAVPMQVSTTETVPMTVSVKVELATIPENYGLVTYSGGIITVS